MMFIKIDLASDKVKQLETARARADYNLMPRYLPKHANNRITWASIEN